MQFSKRTFLVLYLQYFFYLVTLAACINNLQAERCVPNTWKCVHVQKQTMPLQSCHVCVPTTACWCVWLYQWSPKYK